MYGIKVKDKVFKFYIKECAEIFAKVHCVEVFIIE